MDRNEVKQTVIAVLVILLAGDWMRGGFIIKEHYELNMGNSVDRNELGEKLHHISDMLDSSNPENNAADFRAEIRDIKEELDDSPDPEIRFLLFFLDKFMKDLWDNIAMTSSQRLEDEFISRLLKDLSGPFQTLGNGFQEEDPMTCLEGYTNLTDIYLLHIEKEKAKENSHE